MAAQAGGMPKLDAFSFKKINEVFGKPSDPEHGVQESCLDILDNYFKSVERLFEREGEKQNMHKNGYTPEQEKEYLQKLKGNMAECVEYFDKIHDFVLLHGNEPEFQQGEYMNNGIDHITGIGNDSDRDSSQAIGQLKGQIHAIDNGWGMDELVYLGSVGVMKSVFDKNKAKIDNLIEKNKTSYESRKKEYDDLKADPKADPKKLAEYEERMKESQKRFESSKGRKVQELDLENDLNEFMDDIFSRKVNSPSDKLRVINKIDKFVEDSKKKYPDTNIFKPFEIDLKELLKDQRAKTIGSLSFDSSINELKAGNKGTWFGKNDYDQVIAGLSELDTM